LLSTSINFAGSSGVANEKSNLFPIQSFYASEK
jgi:hypothetical protein